MAEVETSLGGAIEAKKDENGGVISASSLALALLAVRRHIAACSASPTANGDDIAPSLACRHEPPSLLPVTTLALPSL